MGVLPPNLPPSLRHHQARHRINRLCGLAVVIAKQVAVNPQGDVRLRMPKSLTDRDDVNPGINELGGVRVA